MIMLNVLAEQHMGMIQNMFQCGASSWLMVQLSKKNFNGPGISNIHLYEMMCKILGIYPANNDGKIDSAIDYLRKKVLLKPLKNLPERPMKEQ